MKTCTRVYSEFIWKRPQLQFNVWRIKQLFTHDCDGQIDWFENLCLHCNSFLIFSPPKIDIKKVKNKISMVISSRQRNTATKSIGNTTHGCAHTYITQNGSFTIIVATRQPTHFRIHYTTVRLCVCWFLDLFDLLCKPCRFIQALCQSSIISWIVFYFLVLNDIRTYVVVAAAAAVSSLFFFFALHACQKRIEGDGFVFIDLSYRTYV